MAKATVPRYMRPGAVRSSRILSWPRDRIRPNDTDVPKTSHILAQDLDKITAENGLHLRKEQQ